MPYIQMSLTNTYVEETDGLEGEIEAVTPEFLIVHALEGQTPAALSLRSWQVLTSRDQPSLVQFTYYWEDPNHVGTQFMYGHFRVK